MEMGIAENLGERVRHLETLETVMDHVYATTAAGQSIPNNAFNTVIYGTEVYDTGGEYNPATGILTAGRAGHLHITASAMFVATITWTETESAELGIVTSGGLAITLGVETDQSAANHFVRVDGSCTVQMAIGETVYVRLFQNSGAALALFAGSASNYVMFDWLF